MNTSKKIIWIAFAIFIFIQLGSSFLTHKNQDNLSFLMEMKEYIPYMLYFSLVGLVLFMFSFMMYQLDGIKAKKQIANLENDKNELKAKLFDMQEGISKPTVMKVLPTIESEPKPKQNKEEGSSESEENSD